MTPLPETGNPRAAGGSVPNRMAPASALLAHAAPQLRERSLVEFLSDLYRS